MTPPAPSRPPVDRSLLAVALLTEGLLAAFADFSCGDDEDDADLNEFIRDDAWRLQSLNVVRTYVALYDGQACGYVALMADAVSLKPNERKKIRAPGVALGFDDHPVVPAIKIARLAVHKATRESCRGVGEYLVRFAFFTALDLAEVAGCRLLTLDASMKSIGFYEKLGFRPNLDGPYVGRKNPSMRLDLFAEEPPSWL
jgi:ribosomal protein S18 acetylase RimI-like enzyme